MERGMVPEAAPRVTSIRTSAPGRLVQESAAAIAQAHRNLLPDLRGMSAREALHELARLGLTVRMQGVGVVVDQDPPAGAPIEPGATCTLVLNRQRAAQTARRGDAGSSTHQAGVVGERR